MVRRKTRKVAKRGGKRPRVNGFGSNSGSNNNSNNGSNNGSNNANIPMNRSVKRQRVHSPVPEPFTGENVGENVFDPEWADTIIEKFQDFLDLLEEKQEELDEEGVDQSDFLIKKTEIAIKLLEAFGSSAATVERTEQPGAFNDDLAALMAGVSI